MTFKAMPSEVGLDRASSRPNRRFGGAGTMLRVALAIMIVLGGGWLLVTQSLPFAVARSNPELALSLNPNHPAALLSKARSLRRQLARATSVTEPTDSIVARDPDTHEWQVIRKEIRELATAIIRIEPLNAEAYRLLGETTDEPDEASKYMRSTVARSRRVPSAVFALLNNSLRNGDVEAAVRHADTLMTTEPKLTQYILPYLAALLPTERGRSALRDVLQAKPSWRARALGSLPRQLKDPSPLVDVLLALRQTDAPPTDAEYGRTLYQMVRQLNIADAYSVWLQFRSAEQLERVGLLYNPNFEQDLTKVPFDWSVGRARNAVGTIATASTPAGNKAFNLIFGRGRVQSPPLQQTLVLPAGSYELRWKIRGSLTGVRGLVWRVQCLGGPILGKSKQMVGDFSDWTGLSLNFIVPDTGKCEGQSITLVHDARTPSEEIISGEAWIDDLVLLRCRNN